MDGLPKRDANHCYSYKMAEKISERLGEMSSDLTLVIEELNEISANLSKSKKTDDPVSFLLIQCNLKSTKLIIT